MRPRVLITGGAGFIGTNLADQLLRDGHEVTILDNMSRSGVQRNVQWLMQRHHKRLEVARGDIRNPADVRDALTQVGTVFHFAAQVAVTTSVADPRTDFDINLGGTMNLLEEVRRLRRPPVVLFTSTNKVYGDLEDVAMNTSATRYEPKDQRLRQHGISESRPLSFCSPYGCSKGGADQYVLDHAKSFGIDSVVFRMSCIYGDHQQGNEDQGWVAHLFKQALSGSPITLYGDGRQVRDVLFVDDLVEAMLAAVQRIERVRGLAFNIGGGAERTLSLLELIAHIGEVLEIAPDVRTAPWRIGDQRWYVSDTRRFQDATGWTPRTPLRGGLERLRQWLESEELRPALAEVS